MKEIDFGEDNIFIENYQKLKSAQKMSELYHCSKGAVLHHAKKIGYDNSNNKEIKITAYPIEQIIQDYEQLKSANRVGEKYGCSGVAVRNYLTKNGYQLKNFTRKLADVSDEELIQQYDLLKSAEKVGKKYDCSDTAVLQRMKKIGYDVNSNKQYKLSKEDKQAIIAAYHTNSSGDLAKKYNVSRGMITKLWYDNDLIGKEVSTDKTTAIDLTGKRFGLWTVLYPTENRAANGSIMWYCRCDCGIEREVSSLSLRRGQSLSCGAHANISRGNEKIKLMLQEANIPFELEKKFPTCKDIKEMPFDFYVNNQYLIEYDGIQHFDVDTRYDYEYTHKHDIMKSKWCKENNIPLIRIPYTHFDNLVLNDLLLETSAFIENYAD